MLENAPSLRDAPSSVKPRSANGLAGAFLALLGLTSGLIVLGALVRAHDAGLACPDWPLCFGEWIPRMDLRVAFEWTHRAVAGTVAFGFAGLALMALRSAHASRELVVLLICGAVLLAVQIVLGALTVWLQLAQWTVTAHLITGNTFALTLLLIACSLGSWDAPAARVQPAARRLVCAGAVLLFAQMVLGGLVASNYAGLACPDWPRCGGEVWFPTFRGRIGLHLFHRLNGYALLCVLAASAWMARREAPLHSLTATALALGALQVSVGIANVLLRIPIEVTGLHSALASALVLTTTLAMRRCVGSASAD